jgi:hypothetical protein
VDLRSLAFRVVVFFPEAFRVADLLFEVFVLAGLGVSSGSMPI